MEIKENLEFIFERIIKINKSQNKLINEKISYLNLQIKLKNPDRDKLGKNFDALIKFCKELDHFSDIIDEIEPKIHKIVQYLGENFQNISNLLRSKELGKKFPIVLTNYNKNWINLYKKEAEKLLSQFYPDVISRIEHFGSTAIPDLSAKPIIDLLIEIKSFEKAKKILLPILDKEGYGYSWRSESQPAYMSFFKGYNKEGVQKYHLHMAPLNHTIWDRLLFRDYLIEFPEKAIEYEKLKIKLARRYKYDREAYTNGKTELVRKLTQEAIIYYNPIDSL